MTAPRAPRRGKRPPSNDAGAIPEQTIEVALPHVADDYVMLISHSPKGDPEPDPKKMTAHYAAAQVVFDHMLQLAALSRRVTEGEVTPEQERDATLVKARAGMAQEAKAKPEDAA
jgi:hypothetical protein